MRALFAYIILSLILCSCGICGKVGESQTVYIRDSVYIEKTEYRDSLIYVPIPVESHSNVAPDSSHLETSVAFSDAWIDTCGLLHHSLENKQTSVSSMLQLPTTKIYAQAQTQSEKIIREIKYVKKKQTWKNWIIAVCLILIIFAYRKQLIKLIKKWLMN